VSTPVTAEFWPSASPQVQAIKDQSLCSSILTGRVAGKGGTDVWQLLSTLVEVPEGADRLIMLPRATNQQPSDTVLFDDAQVIRVP